MGRKICLKWKVMWSEMMKKFTTSAPNVWIITVCLGGNEVWYWRNFLYVGESFLFKMEARMKIVKELWLVCWFCCRCFQNSVEIFLVMYFRRRWVYHPIDTLFSWQPSGVHHGINVAAFCGVLATWQHLILLEFQ